MGSVKHTSSMYQ